MRFLVLAAALAACATQKPAEKEAFPVPAPPASARGAAQASSPAAATPSKPLDPCASVLADLKANDVGALWPKLDARFQQAVPKDKVEALTGQIAQQLGVMRSYELVEQGTQKGLQTRTYDATYERGALTARCAFDPSTGLVAGLLLRPGSAKHPSSAFRTVDLKVGPYALDGTLTLPAGAGPFPALVLVQGSGPHDRDETVGPNRPFFDLAEGLAARGVATLRYEKRSYARPDTLPTDTVTVDGEVEDDAVAALKLLATRPEVAKGGLFLLGHSLGATLAPEIAHKAGGVAGLVLLAPAGRPLRDVIVDQYKFGRAPPAAVAQVERQAKEMAAGTIDPQELVLGVPARYWMDLDRRDALGLARKLAVPILVLRGSADFQVTAPDEAAWRKALAGVKGARVEELPGLNHLFIRGEGEPGPRQYEVPGHVDAAAIDAVAGFAKDDARAP